MSRGGTDRFHIGIPSIQTRIQIETRVAVVSSYYKRHVGFVKLGSFVEHVSRFRALHPHSRFWGNAQVVVGREQKSCDGL